MKIREENYTFEYNSDTAVITCSGFLDLRGKEGYAAIADLLGKVVDLDPLVEKITLDVRNLEFLNSSGITTLGGFVIKLRKRGDVGLIILCSNNHSWQARSMKGLAKLMPKGMEILFE